MNLTVVKEEIVSDVRKTAKGLLIFIRDGFITYIAARHHQSLEGTIEQKMVKRRVGKHNTEGILVRSYSMGDWRIFPPSQNDNGPLHTQ
jgi:hypothetical protein